MQIGGASSHIASSRGFQTYAREALVERLSNNLSEQNRQQTQTRSMGFSLGKLGVRFETEVPAQNIADGAQNTATPNTASSAQSTDHAANALTMQALRNQTAVDMAAGDAVSPRMMREGANAYAQADARYQQQQTPAMFAASV